MKAGIVGCSRKCEACDGSDGVQLKLSNTDADVARGSPIAPAYRCFRERTSLHARQEAVGILVRVKVKAIETLRLAS